MSVGNGTKNNTAYYWPVEVTMTINVLCGIGDDYAYIYGQIPHTVSNLSVFLESYLDQEPIIRSKGCIICLG